MFRRAEVSDCGCFSPQRELWREFGRPSPRLQSRKVASAFCQAEAWEDALKLLETCKSSQLHVNFTKAIRACDQVICLYFLSKGTSEASHWPKSLQLLQRMETISIVNIIAYTSVIAPMLRPSNWPSILQLLEKIESKSIQKDSQFLNASASALARHSAWQLALLLPQDLDDFARSAMIYASAQGIQWQLAVQLAEVSNARPVLLTGASAACADASQWRLALLLATQAMPSGGASQSFKALQWDL